MNMCNKKEKERLIKQLILSTKIYYTNLSFRCKAGLGFSDYAKRVPWVQGLKMWTVLITAKRYTWKNVWWIHSTFYSYLCSRPYPAHFLSLLPLTPLPRYLYLSFDVLSECPPGHAHYCPPLPTILSQVLSSILIIYWLIEYQRSKETEYLPLAVCKRPNFVRFKSREDKEYAMQFWTWSILRF